MVSSNYQAVWTCLVAFFFVGSTAFAPPMGSNNQQLTCLEAMASNENNNRRSFMSQAAFAGASLLLPNAAMAGLLDDFGTDPSKIVIKEKEPEKPAGQRKGEAAIDPTLRASYYYPTAKKRYLPRIQKVTANIEQIPQFIANGQWEEVQDFSKTAENAILPLQLYVSSLDGQGLGMANSYAKTMKKDATIYEQQYKILEKALKKKDKDMALSAVQEMGIAVAEYRQAGRLKDDDGFIPSVDEIKRSTMRRPTQSAFVMATQ